MESAFPSGSLGTRSRGFSVPSFCLGRKLHTKLLLGACLFNKAVDMNSENILRLTKEIKVLYYKKSYVMRAIIIILLSAGSLLLAQEPSLIHYNFSFEKEYGKGWNDFNLSNDLVYFTIRIFNSRGERIYNRHIEKPDFVKDKYGYCLKFDTLKTGLNDTGQFKLSIKYKLVSGFTGKSSFTFKNSDSIRNIALEIFFDQAEDNNLIFDTSFINLPQYKVIKNPKPALVVKYLKVNETVKFFPYWFEHVRLTRRPIYKLKNISNDSIFRISNNVFSGIWGNLYIHEQNKWQGYAFGGTCGESGHNTVNPGGEIKIVEAYAIGNPYKLREGFYRYAVNYLDKFKKEKTAVTYFSVMYSK